MRRVFVNYRRDDTGGVARKFKADLEGLLPGTEVYLDQSSNEGGENYRAKINTEIASCAVLVTLIGPRWLDVPGPDGKPRLHCPDDLVCDEIDLALDQGKVVLPVLVGGAKMPGRTELPDTIKRLARHHALSLGTADGEADMRRIATRVAKLIAGQSPLKVWRTRLLNSMVYPLAAASFFCFGYAMAVNFPTSRLVKWADFTGSWEALYTPEQKLGIIEDLRQDRDRALAEAREAPPGARCGAARTCRGSGGKSRAGEAG